MGRFLELSECKLEDKKNLVISIDIEKKISIAQQIIAIDENTLQHQKIFLKNAINTDVEGLKTIRDTIDKALEKCK